MIRPIAFAALLALAACAESEEASLAPIDESAGYNVIDPVVAPIEQVSEISLGEWTEGMLDERPALLFGPVGTEPLFSLRCDDRDGVLLQRHGMVPTGTAEMMTLTLGTTSRRLAVNPVAGTVPKLRAAVPASDELLAQLSGATVPITVAVGDGPALNLPPSPLLAGFIRECTTQDSPAAAAASGNEASPAPAASGNNAAAEPDQ